MCLVRQSSKIHVIINNTTIIIMELKCEGGNWKTKEDNTDVTWTICRGIPLQGIFLPNETCASNLTKKKICASSSCSQEALFREDRPAGELPRRAISRNCTARFHVVPSTLPFAFPTFPFSESFDFHLTDGRGWDEKVKKYVRKDGQKV